MANSATTMDGILNPRESSSTAAMRGVPSLPPLHLPRSHLDSATYRSFVCLLSHCLGATAKSLNPHGPGADEASSISPMAPEVSVRLTEESGLDPEEVPREENGDLGAPVSVELETVGFLGGEGRSPVQDGIDLGLRDEQERGVEFESSRLNGADDGVGASAVVGCQNGGSTRGLVQGEVDGVGSYMEMGGESGDNAGKGGENIEKNELGVACFDSSRVLEEGEELLMVDDNGSHLPKVDVSELFNIQKELSDCILEVSPRVDEFVGRDVSRHCAQEKLQEEVEHVDGDCFDLPAQTTISKERSEHEKGQKGHAGSSAVAYHHDHVFESRELVDDSNHKKLHSVMSQDEISCPVGVTDGDDHQESTSCMKPVNFSSSNLHGKIMTKPLNVVNGAEFEEGEIPGEFGDKIGVQAVEDTSTRVDMDGVNITMMENCSVEHDFDGKSNSRNYSLNIVDYSDLYEIGHTSGGNKLSTLPESKIQSRRKKKNGGDKLMISPRTGESNKKKNDESSATSMDMSEKISIPKLQKESKLMDAGVMEKNVKTKKGPLTEERKAKKKQAKKRKRAEKNRKLGIKRLKIQPVSLPKKVIYCDFYLKGRCQKGDQCSFSHDTTPLTKSQPCKYFACQSCLKGDDCPFDHELWKYPCHNFMSRGTCSRGEECKFSHKIQVAEGSVGSAVSKLDTLKSSEAPDPGKQLSTSVSSFQPVKYSAVNLKFGMSQSEWKHSLEIARKPETKMPKGINILSFGKNPSENANDDKKLLLETSGKQLHISRSSFQAIKNSPTSTKCSSPNSKFKPSVEQLKQTPQMNAPKGVHFLSFGENMIDNANKLAKKSDVIEIKTNQDNGSSRLQVSEIPPSDSLQGFSSRGMESDATKILEEFLFCGDT